MSGSNDAAKTSRRGFVKVIGAGVGGIVVGTIIGYGLAPQISQNPSNQSKSSSSSSSSISTQSSQSASQALQILSVGQTADPSHFQVALTTDTTIQVVSSALYNGLVKYELQEQSRTSGVRIVPDLAEFFEASPDGKKWTFYLRRNVRWHDGQRFTSADVALSLQTAKKYHPIGSAILANMASVDTPDDYTAILNLSAPFAGLERALDIYTLPMSVASHIYSGTDPTKNPANLAPIGTGPFKFSKWDKGNQIVFQKNADYFKPLEPHFDQIVFKIIPDISARAAAMSAGEIQYMSYWATTIPVATQLAQQNSSIQPITWGDQQLSVIALMGFNVTKAPTNDAKLRQALAYAIDRDQINQLVALGNATPIYEHMPPTNPLYWPNAPSYQLNPTTAQQLLDQAGYKVQSNGFRFDLAITSHPPRDAIAQVIVNQFRNVGINATLETMDFASFGQKVYVQGNFNCDVTAFTFGPDPAIGMHRAYLSSNIGKVNGNGPRYTNPTLDQLFSQAASEIDFAKREAIYQQILTTLYNDVPIIPLLLWHDLPVQRKSVNVIWTGNDLTDNLEEAIPVT